jgi:hypothetical protein
MPNATADSQFTELFTIIQYLSNVKSILLSIVMSESESEVKKANLARAASSKFKKGIHLVRDGELEAAREYRNKR